MHISPWKALIIGPTTVPLGTETVESRVIEFQRYLVSQIWTDMDLP